MNRLGHSSIVLTADTYTSVLPELARDCAEAIARLILAAAKIRRYPGQPVKLQVKRGAPPGTRTPNPRY